MAAAKLACKFFKIHIVLQISYGFVVLAFLLQVLHFYVVIIVIRIECYT